MPLSCPHGLSSILKPSDETASLKALPAAGRLPVRPGSAWEFHGHPSVDEDSRQDVDGEGQTERKPEVDGWIGLGDRVSQRRRSTMQALFACLKFLATMMSMSRRISSRG